MAIQTFVFVSNGTATQNGQVVPNGVAFGRIYLDPVAHPGFVPPAGSSLVLASNFAGSFFTPAQGPPNLPTLIALAQELNVPPNALRLGIISIVAGGTIS